MTVERIHTAQEQTAGKISDTGGLFGVQAKRVSVSKTPVSVTETPISVSVIPQRREEKRRKEKSKSVEE
ncbi:MAG TPA: hypothetical protein DEO95_10335 [Ruminococcaceae bacterium]|nr:hypothetical protein [Oscillospiraceae bacterium]